MRVLKTLSLAVIGAGLIMGTASAQDNSAKIGVIDLAYVFEKHPTIQSQIQVIDNQIKDVEAQINSRREDLLKQAEGLGALDENSPDYRALEERLSKQEADLKLDFVRKEKQFAEAKAGIIFNEYSRIEEKISKWAVYNNMSVVLRYRRMEMDPSKPATVSQGLQKSVVYYNKNYDLTDVILAEIIKESGSAAPAAAAAQAPNGQRRQ
jgi:Skp family chaperone for outer membrane proteins